MISSVLALIGASHVWHWCAAAAPLQLAQKEQHRIPGEAGKAEAQRSLRSTDGRQKIIVEVKGEPKSGTTWLGVTLAEVLKEWCSHADGCKLGLGADGLYDAAATPASGKRLSSSTIHKHTIPHIGHGGGIDGSKPPRVSEEKIHAAAAKLLNETSSMKYAVVFRDPRDVAVSACHYKAWQTCGKVENLPSYVHKIMVHLSGWTNLRYRLFRAAQSMDPTRVGLFFYEDMSENGAAAIRTEAKLFEIDMTAEQVEAVLSRTSFVAMHEKAANQSFFGGTKRVRKGGSCGFKKELPDEVAVAVTKLMRGTLLDELSDRWHC